MSEIRSWDGACDYLAEPEKGIYPSINRPQPHPQVSSDKIPVRVVAWPEGAPKQEGVPQAGESLIWGEGDRNIHNSTVTVISGIPVMVMDYWGLAVFSVRGTCHFAWLKNLKEIPPARPRSYTEDEILEAMVDAEETYFRRCQMGDSSYNFSKILIDEMQMRKQSQ